MRKHHLAALLLCGLLLPALAACGDDDEGPAAAKDDTSGSPSSLTQADALSVTDPWVKAAEASDGMTAAFGTLVNGTDEDITVVSASTTLNDRTELHETVENADGSMAMQPKDGGFVIPAGGTHELRPGGDHIMLMGLTEPLAAGTTVAVELTLGDGSTTTVEATVKPFDGADENYQGSDMGDMGGMESDGGDR